MSESAAGSPEAVATDLVLHFANEPYQSRITEALCRDEETTLAFNALMEELRSRIAAALQAAHERAKALESERFKVQQLVNEKLPEYVEKIAALKERAERAEAALQKYGRHEMTCAHHWNLNSEYECRCGFEEARRDTGGG